MKNESIRLIKKWQYHLGLQDWNIIVEEISENQVIDIYSKRIDESGEFVGINRNFKNKEAILYTTRHIYEDDVIHELIHLRFPKMNETNVECLTNILMRVIENHFVDSFTEMNEDKESVVSIFTHLIDGKPVIGWEQMPK